MSISCKQSILLAFVLQLFMSKCYFSFKLIKLWSYGWQLDMHVPVYLSLFTKLASRTECFHNDMTSQMIYNLQTADWVTLTWGSMLTLASSMAFMVCVLAGICFSCRSSSFSSSDKCVFSCKTWQEPLTNSIYRNTHVKSTTSTWKFITCLII